MPIAAIIAGVGALGGGIASAVGASKAAGAQASAANNAAQLQHQDAQDALGFQRQQYQNSLQMLNPYLQTGYGALSMLRQGVGIGGAMPQGFTLNQQPSVPMGIGGALGGPSSSLASPARSLPPGVQRVLQPGSFDALDAGGQTGFGNGIGDTFSPTGSTLTVPASQNGFNQINSAGAPSSGFFPMSGGPAQLGPAQFAGATDPGQGTGVIDGSANATLSNSTPGADGNAQLGFGSLISPFSEQFNAPTVTDDPGYKFRLQQGMDALQNSAAAKGGLLSGGTAKALNDYAQGSASQEYGNAYNRAMDQYLNRANLFFTNQNNQFNKLASLSGMGQTAGNTLSASGLTTGQGMANTLLSSGQMIGNDLQNAGAARGSGYQSIGNSIGNGINQIGSLALLSQILKQGGTPTNTNSGWGVV